MAQKNKAKPNASFSQSEFINYPLSAEQKKEIKAWQPTFEEIDDSMLKIAEQGYRLTLRWDERSEAFACWINPSGEDHPNTGLTLSGRGSTPLKAFKQALYIHNLFDGDWAGNYKSFKEGDLDD
jgi:hypothetical protein